MVEGMTPGKSFLVPPAVVSHWVFIPSGFEA